MSDAGGNLESFEDETILLAMDLKQLKAGMQRIPNPR
jgi:hypothetical protein